ncbi:carboxymuconolactone decarboxylase family protein [Blastococcus sp. TML/M2B]|uniref:carboxymuconolactone decarboxylase family protein n=1 Tax=unclassified Blastococcus TaxID=2619396 RepID=UPI00190C80BC|nr:MULTISPECIES: carboxymuconolactone decarboxylase family protein [unclassified Blastococcus]MBN1091696.1 carboxymuconolactone decarboxylase family protein [Blastococcus sp. TML/M2B]MBN1094745.1 carboxymuconolactone decarboxylase family protein [Blastococcus sp. TML/C7B]
MSWIADADEAASTEAAEAFDRDRATLGYVANYTRLLARRPAVYEAWRALNAAVKASMDPRRYELATLAAARQLRSSYCSLAHGGVLVDRFGAEPEVRAISGGELAALGPVDAAVVRVAAKVAAGAAAMTPEDLAELRTLGLDDDEILDVVLAAAARCFFSSVLDATGTEPDAQYRSMDAGLRAGLTVGRPIAEA